MTIPTDTFGCRTTTRGLKVGDRVTVLPPYTGNGTYGRDDATGPAYIHRIDEPDFIRLSRTPDGPWFVGVHVCRIAIEHEQPARLARTKWIEQQVREIAKDCGVSQKEARETRSQQQWNKEWLDHVAASTAPVSPAIWRGIVDVCEGRLEEAYRFLQHHRLERAPRVSAKRALGFLVWRS